jgi:hypothetical protein
MLAVRSGWTSEAIRLGAVGSSFGPRRGGRTGTEWVVGATGAPFQASNERVMVAVPGPAASLTRTGPSKLTCQQRSRITHFSFSGGAPGLAAGSDTSATGLASLGMVSS